MAEQLDIWGSDKSERGSLADRLRALLEGDTQAGMVPLSRGGKISRKHYAGMLGCARPALTRHIDILAEFERRLGAATGPMRLLSSMREWLARSYESRELGVRDGKIDRAAFAAQFGLRGGTFLTRYPEIRALIENYDARAKRENYLPANRQEELDRVRVALEHGPELSKDRKNISLTALSAASGVPVSRLRENIFAKVIADAQSRVAENVKASKIDPYFHGRVFPFSNLLPTWGSRFTERAATRFKQVISGLAEPSSKHIYLSLLNVLIWIGESDNPNCLAVVAEAQKDGRVSAAGEWEDALFAHRDHLLMGVANGTLTENSVDSAITRLRTALDALASGGVVPGTATPIPGVKHARRQALHRPSVAEVTFSARDTADYVAFARAHFEDSCKRWGLDMGSGDSEPFFGSIGQALNTGAALPDDPAEAVRMVLERRLEKLRARAWAFVEEAASMHERGQDLISKATIDSAQFEAAYLGNHLNKYQRTMLVHNLFPGREASDDQVERGVANFLALIDQLRGGIPPLLSSPDPDYGQFFAKRYLHYGGLQAIQPMLIPDNDAVGSVLTLYLLDSGANVAVGRTLDRECIEVSDLEGHSRITGHKAKAEGKPIIVDLPEDSLSVRAINWLLSAGKKLPDSATADEDRLFLMRCGSRVQLMTPHWYTNWFKSFAGNTPGLEDLKLTPSMLRPSVLLHAALCNDGRLTAGMALGQHTVGVSQGYQQKWATRLLYDQTVRRFQTAFETVVVANIPDAALKLGITEEQFESRLGNLQATGLGTFCRDRRGRPGERNQICSTIDCWNDCPHLMIVAEVDAIATLQLWQSSLREVRADWERDRPERWDAVWLPWLCLVDVVEEKMARGPMIKIWKAAAERAAEISAQRGYVLPRPW